MVDLQGNIIECENICQLFDLKVMQYNTIIAAVPKYWWKSLKFHIKEVDEKYKSTYENYIEKQRPTQYYYKSINGDEELCRSIYIRWKHELKLDLN